MSKKGSVIVLAGVLLGLSACAPYMPPARTIPPGDADTDLCKETYLHCRSGCADNEDNDTRLKCAELCERDVDTCLMQRRAPKS